MRFKAEVTTSTGETITFWCVIWCRDLLVKPALNVSDLGEWTALPMSQWAEEVGETTRMSN